ncbi:MAG: signal recognition particle-docking protein FtsY [Bacteroidetes bacterium]|nr:signal recognition particle-docking protein FtsY [Bacteroidota bacterium]
MGFFEKVSKFSSGLSKTRSALVQRIQTIVSKKTKIDDEALDQVEQALLEADVGTETTSIILENIRQRVKIEGYDDTDSLLSLIKDEVSKILQLDAPVPASLSEIPVKQKPYVIMVVGVNGSGKTTTIGKLAYQYRQNGYRVIIGAADTFRAAANEQLEIWAKRAGVEVIKQKQGSDPAAVAHDALSSAISKNADVVIIDTAGRLHTNTPLMEELKKIKRVLGKKLEGAPHEVLLVLDATTGQNGLQQLKVFNDAVQVTGIVLTKLDGTAKGGIVLAIAHQRAVPVKLIGIGEGIDDLQLFDREAFVEALFEGTKHSV